MEAAKPQKPALSEQIISDIEEILSVGNHARVALGKGGQITVYEERIKRRIQRDK